MDHSIFMQRCLELATVGAGHVAPNPMVGAVLACDGKIISEGAHLRFGGPHAEVHAIGAVTDPGLLSKCTLYVNLEPCTHFGKTPPCADLILSSGIKTVVISNLDPNKQVHGKGIRKLKNAGVSVINGVLEGEGRWLNRRFFTFHEKQRPYIILKWAESPDGFIAPAPRPKNMGITWISNETSRALVHRWRGEEQSILVGRNTVLNDNPQLTIRGVEGNNPLRLVIDPDDNLPRSVRVFDKQAPTLVFNHKRNSVKGNITGIKVPLNKNTIEFVLAHLFSMGIVSVFVEGGSTTLKGFIDQGLWDEARIFTGTKPLQSGLIAPETGGKLLSRENIAGDQLSIFINQSPHQST